MVAGARPTGLALAGELALAGVDVSIVERRPDQALAGSRAGGLGARTLEVLDQRGIVERFLAQGQKAQVTGFAVTRLDISDFPTRHNYRLGLRQKHIEHILARMDRRARGADLQGARPGGLRAGRGGRHHRDFRGVALRAAYLVCCDGGRSLVRKTAAIAFPGWEATTRSIVAEAEMTEEPPLGVHRTARGIHAFSGEQYEIRDGKMQSTALFHDRRIGRQANPSPPRELGALPAFHDPLGEWWWDPSG